MSGAILCADMPELPDAGEGACCMGAAVYGPGRCTCWESHYTEEQEDVVQGPPAVRVTACVDCAFRPRSPERSGDERYQHSAAGELDDVAGGDIPFFCHQGMRRVLRLTHPAGGEIEAAPAAYEPAGGDGIAYKANGLPADICAGWAARRKALLEGATE